jgi:hypothetical protein
MRPRWACCFSFCRPLALAHRPVNDELLEFSEMDFEFARIDSPAAGSSISTLPSSGFVYNWMDGTVLFFFCLSKLSGTSASPVFSFVPGLSH